MSKTKSILKIQLKTSNCNIVIKNGHIARWFLKWENNLITAYTYFPYDSKNHSDIFKETENVTNLVLLIDILTLIANQDINTSVVISTDPKIDIYIGNVTSTSKSFDEFGSEIKALKHQVDASTLDSSDRYRIDPNTKLTLSEDELLVIYGLLNKTSEINKYTPVLKKLINYWRKGADLNYLQFMDESFLSFFKIIEYFAKRSKVPIKKIPKTYTKTKSLSMAYKFAVGAKLKNLSKNQYIMISTLIYIRNNFDIAHSKIRPFPDNHTGALYYSYLDTVWDYHSDLCQITRLVLLREIGISGLSLVEDGGLYRLSMNSI